MLGCHSDAQQKKPEAKDAIAEQKSGSLHVRNSILHHITPPYIQKGMFGWRKSLFLGLGGFSCCIGRRLC